MTRSVFNPKLQNLPSSVDAVLHGHKVEKNSLSAMASINECVVVEENGDLEYFKNGGYTDIVLGQSLKIIGDNEPARVTLAVIEAFHLDHFFHLTNKMIELKQRSEDEMKQIMESDSH